MKHDPRDEGAEVTYGVPIIKGHCRRCGREVSAAYNAPMTCGNCRDTVLARAARIQKKAGGELTPEQLRDENRDQRKYHID